ncbi:hypothetical protein PLESTM_001310300 [Pleodorina starrii]|nr:hypothetical protein PLESTM_001310300 [Pleodorina starrii]
MPGGKLARILQVVGGAPRDDQRKKAAAKHTRSLQPNGIPGKDETRPLNGNATSRHPAQPASTPHGEPGRGRARKRRRDKQRPAAQAKRARRSPAAKAPAGTAAAAGAGGAAAKVLAEVSEQLEAERQKILAGRSAYEALMEELARSGRDRGGGGGGGGGRGKADLRAQLQLLRSEQMGQSSEEEDEDEEEEDEEEDGEDESEDGDEGEEGESSDVEEEELAATAGRRRGGGGGGGAAANRLPGSDGAGSDADEEEGEEGEGEEDGSDGDGGAVNGAVNGQQAGRSKRKKAARRSDGGGEDDEGGGPSSSSSSGLEDGGDGEDAEGGGDGANGPPGQRSAAGAAAAVDTWARHVGRELSDAEVAALTTAGKCAYADAPSADEVHLSAWGQHARWQLRVYGNSGGAKAAKAAAAAAAAAAVPAALSSVGLTELPTAPANLREYGVKERLVARWREVRQEDEARVAAGASTSGAAAASASAVNGGAAAAASSSRPAVPDFRSPQQRSLFALLNTYADVHLPYRPYPTDASLDAPDPLLDAVLLHCLNHVAKTADRIKKNNHALQLQQQQQQAQQALLKAQQQQQQQQAKGKGKGAKAGKGPAAEGEDQQEQQQPEDRQEAEQEAEPEQQGQQQQGPGPKQQGQEEVEGQGGTPRDQGFTRPKVLLLLPQRNFAFRAVRRLVALAIRETRSDSVQGKERFVEQFTDPEEGDMAEEDMDAAAKARLAARPPEHRALFAGNVDDHFRLGVKVTKGAIRLFADLYDSDIIVASPVALATKLAEDKASDPHSAPDFLSSIELLVLDRADVMGMQNWAHVETVVSALNQLPREQHGTDIMRVRDWYLCGQAAHYRQTVLLAAFAAPHGNALARAGANHAGALRLAGEQAGVLGRVVPQVRQLFERFAAASPAAAGDARFEFFMRLVWPRLKDSVSRGLLLFVPSYFDFVRLRNALKADDSVDFATISEYSTNAEVIRARARFYHGQRRMLLYTERAHFYHRYRIRGIKDLVFYGLPDHGEYYSELVNLLEEAAGGGGGGAAGGGSGHQATVTALFCPWDVLQLERVVGSGRARRMLKGESGTYMFC